MTVSEAVDTILGKHAADAIRADQGEKWAVVAAIAAAKNTDDPRAIAALRSTLPGHPNR